MQKYFLLQTLANLNHLNRDTDKDTALLKFGLWNGVPWRAAWNSPFSIQDAARTVCACSDSLRPPESAAILLLSWILQTEKWNFSTHQTGKRPGIEENISGSLYCFSVIWDCGQDTRRSCGMFGRSTRQESQLVIWCQEAWTECPEVAPI